METPFTNALQKTVARFMEMPRSMRMPMLSYAIGNLVKYVGTSGVRFEKMTENEVVVSLSNRRKVQNHIQQIHAAAMILLAETASGMVVGMNVPDDRVPVIKTLHADFVKRSKGAMRAVAHLTPEQISHIRATEKGDTTVAVTVTDEEGKEPILVQAIWAWVPKVRKPVAPAPDDVSAPDAEPQK
jgi:acyl-coenzyme A thioesterase PaaI-like protein